ncbi:uncharacterized protein LOC130622131 isoform X2 [Hydractinia symbiolongicarpus]|nr:uncharacterized protein LOC130622131 isoform X2 [Hydractinia symbiolongicarpus]
MISLRQSWTLQKNLQRKVRNILSEEKVRKNKSAMVMQHIKPVISNLINLDDRCGTDLRKDTIYLTPDEYKVRLITSVQIQDSVVHNMTPEGHVELYTPGGPIMASEVLRNLFPESMARYEGVSPAVNMIFNTAELPRINVDITASVTARGINLSNFGWQPAKLPQWIVEKIRNTDLYCEPNRGMWYVSTAPVEKLLMKIIDYDNGCRRICYKLLKADLQNWKQQSGDELAGIDKMFFKHILFCMNETYKWEWSNNCLYECYSAVLCEVKKSFGIGILPNYFRKTENLLKNTDGGVLLKVADLARRRRNKLLAPCHLLMSSFIR